MELTTLLLGGLVLLFIFCLLVLLLLVKTMNNKLRRDKEISEIKHHVSGRKRY